MGKKLDLTGQKFDRLVVLKENGRTIWKTVLWECKCACGNITTVMSRNLISGSTRSCGCYKREWNLKTKILDPAFSDLYSNYQCFAKKAKRVFEIPREDFKRLTSQECFYCGKKPSQANKRRGNIYLYNGLDRVNNEKGYTLDNVVPCCGFCNRAKSSASQEVFISWIRRVANHLDEIG